MHVRRVGPMIARRVLAALVMAGLASLAFAQPDDDAARPRFGRAVAAHLTPAGSQPAPIQAGPRTEGTLFYPLQLTMPDPSRLFVLEAEDAFRERMRQEARSRGVRQTLEFPDRKSAAPTRAAPRHWTPYAKLVEPSYVVAGRLFWEQPAFERYGLDLGILQPGVSTSMFLFDTLVWPVRRVSPPFTCNQIYTDCFSPYFNRMNERDRPWWK